MPRRSTLVTALVALLTLTAVGIFGYSTIAGMSFDDALYMTVITLSTVGYGEIQPLDHAGRAFTMVLIVGGLGIVFYSVTLIARDVVEGEFQRQFGRRKVLRQLAQMEEHVIVCGFGRMGRIVCKDLNFARKRRALTS